MKPQGTRPEQCRSCIFQSDGNQVELRPDRLAEIQRYLLKGNTHVCHTGQDRVTLACWGGRDFQLTMWYRMGLIPEPTDAALAEAMTGLGLEPPARVAGQE